MDWEAKKMSAVPIKLEVEAEYRLSEIYLKYFRDLELKTRTYMLCDYIELACFNEMKEDGVLQYKTIIAEIAEN